MKTFTHKIIISLSITALFMMAFNPVQAQRRTGQSRNSETVIEKEAKTRESRNQSENNSVNQENRRKSTVNSYQNANSNSAEKQPVSTQQRMAPKGNNQSHRSPSTGSAGNVRSRSAEIPARTEQRNNRYSSSIRNSTDTKNSQAAARNRTEHNKTLYRIDAKDNRYAPAKNFKGNNNHWAAGSFKSHMHYSNRDLYFYRSYDHRKYNHWNRGWETYYWNVNSWRDYYSAYHPHSYQFHKHYFHHPRYGHVIRRFNYKPVSFIHNNVRYYNYNGHFFRHFRGVGYVLVDMPYGLVFRQLPAVHERVYVNGYLYFRVENLFFESHPYGFALIHYPERYFAMNPGFYNGGYYYPADFSFYRY
jgi:hypothetical protein